MTKRKEKQSRKSLIDAKTKSTKSKLLEKIRDLLKFSDTTITIILTDTLTDEMCADMQKTLKISKDMTTNYSTHGKFYKHTLRVHVNNKQKFKKNIGKIQDKYPGIAIYPEFTSQRKKIWPIFTAAAGFVGGIVKYLLDLLWSF